MAVLRGWRRLLLYVLIVVVSGAGLMLFRLHSLEATARPTSSPAPSLLTLSLPCDPGQWSPWDTVCGPDAQR